MPDKPTVVSYAAGASLAAAALIYVFGPTFAIDNEASNTRKKTIVGLRNQANDCFINSVLQALAGLGELRVYLIRETHRRRIEDAAVYANLVQPDGEELPLWKLQGMQDGLVTQGLKEMLDHLNERPISKKAISPFAFVRVLEVAFKQRISRQQQDAQEFLQIVAERLKDEYHAGQRARLQARRLGTSYSSSSGENTDGDEKEKEHSEKESALPTEASGDQGDATPLDEKRPNASATNGNGNGNAGVEPRNGVSVADGIETTSSANGHVLPLELEDGFPMEGKYESHLECQTCGYKTKPREENFCTITLAVPQVSSTTLNGCFDGIFKTEYIDDFKCEKCRLVHTISNLEHEMARSTSEAFKRNAQDSIDKLNAAIETDPEEPPEDVDLGDIRYAPKRKIAKTTKMTIFPKILAIHLSRSIYGVGQMTQKNSAKVAFPEQLPLGSLLDQHKYKLFGVVTHRGGHNSGHYEAFRRQYLPPHFPNANTFQQSEVYSKTPTPLSTPEIRAKAPASPAISTPDLLSPSPATNSSTPSLESMAVPRSVPADMQTISKDKDKDTDSSSVRSVAASTKSALSKIKLGQDGVMGSPKLKSLQNGSQNPLSSKRGKKKLPLDKWWRVSDEKVREAKTGEVLGMQKEVYLLFYELEK
jgi:ubiquitin carboxyl-terminal hydrolase 16